MKTCISNKTKKKHLYISFHLQPSTFTFKIITFLCFVFLTYKNEEYLKKKSSVKSVYRGNVNVCQRTCIAMCEVSLALSRGLDRVTSKGQSNLLCNSSSYCQGHSAHSTSAITKTACLIACVMGPLQEQGGEMASDLQTE